MQIYEQEHVVKRFWRKEFMEDEQSEKKWIKDSILEKYKGKLVVDLNIYICIILSLTYKYIHYLTVTLLNNSVELSSNLDPEPLKSGLRTPLLTQSY